MFKDFKVRKDTFRMNPENLLSSTPISSTHQERLNSLVESIQRLNPTEYEELFKLLYRNKCDYTRNNNGVFLNLSWLTDEMIDKLEIFVKFCYASRKEIQHYEEICDNLSLMVSNPNDKKTIKEAYDSDCEIEVEHKDSTEENATNTVIPKKIFVPKTSSTMKFYLLKKKFAKMNSYDTSIQNDLEKETFLI